MTLLRNKRKKAGLSQKQLAEMSNVAQQTISAIENGIRGPGAGILLRLAKALGCTMEELIAPEEVDQDDAGGAGGAAGVHSGDENRR